ncbi:MAG: response regulator [Desulfuromusa sp.]
MKPDIQNSTLVEKNMQLSSAYRTLQRVEAQRVALNEITRNYLITGDLEQSLDLLMANAAKFVGAQAGRFLHCSVENDEIKITSVSKMYWFDPSKKIETPQAQKAFAEYAQTLMQSGGQLLIGTLETNQTMILTGEQYLTNRSIPLPTGHPEIESLMLTPISIKGDMLGVIALANCPGGFEEEDKSGLEAFAAEAALLIHADSREVARSAAEETARLRSAFLANMSHELRTPLNIIIGMNQLLQGMKHPKEQQNYLEKIGFSAKQLLELIDDVLDIAKISEGGTIALKESAFQPDELFYGISQLLSFRQGDRKVELHADISREIPPFLFGDTRRLTQILNNLLSNALKFTPQGTVTLQVSLFNQTEDQVTLKFRVTDTGIGISEEQQENVFHPFVQVDSSSTRQHAGSGLGLAISRQLCQLLGGELLVESSLGQGSTFHFALPFKIDATAELKTKFLRPAVDLTGMSILLVNSCPACGVILPAMLEALQFKTDSITSTSGAQMLLKNAVEQKHPYQIVLIGQFLDEMSGLEFAELLASQDLPNTQKILLANPADIAKFSAQTTVLDLAGLVSIPASPADLFNVIANAFGAGSDVHAPTTERSVQWQQAKVLLVDDNEMGREMGRALLENVGIEVYEAVNGLEAVDRVEAEAFDLVLMDVQMPVLDGLSATRAIRNLDKANIENLPIIAMTAHSFTEHRAESVAAGMNDHLTKPINLDALYAALQRWLPGEKQQFAGKTVPLEPSEYADLETALPGIDVKAGIRRVVGDRQLYVSLLKKYLDQFSATEKELRQELELKQLKEAILRIHTLKGVAGSLGATLLQELSGQLETQLTQNRPLSALEPMLLEQHKFLQSLQRLPELNQVSTAGDKTSGSESELRVLLEQILVPLTNLKAQEIKSLLTKIQDKEWPQHNRNQLVQLAELIGHYQFNRATELVQSLLQQSES